MLGKLVNAFSILLLPSFLEYSFILIKEFWKIEQFWLICYVVKKTHKDIYYLNTIGKIMRKSITLKSVVGCNYTKLKKADDLHLIFNYPYHKVTMKKA